MLTSMLMPMLRQLDKAITGRAAQVFLHSKKLGPDTLKRLKTKQLEAQNAIALHKYLCMSLKNLM